MTNIGQVSAYPAGLYAELFASRSFEQRPCLFLDRDGVIVEEAHYLRSVDDVVFVDGVADAVARANAMLVPVVMVTNQSGIGRGLYGWQDFQAVQHHIYDHYRAFNAYFDMVLACAYHAEGLGCYAIADHPWRKPRPGMLHEAGRLLGVDLASSFMVGDTLADLKAAQAAGLASGALVKTGHGLQQWAEKGEAAFSEWSKAGSFRAVISDNGGEAIHGWLHSLRRSAQT